jgi:uncharacterized membrane protein YagU involved in acid resistance
MNRILKDVLYGVIGGVAGTAVIGGTMKAISKLQTDEDQKREHELVPEQPTEKLARKISENVLGVKMSPETKHSMGQVVYWGYGIFWGGVYGLLRKRVSLTAWGVGLPFGIGFSLIGPAVMLPALDLTPPATRFPLSAHARGLISHYAYAATVEGVCRLCENVEEKITVGEPRTNVELRRVS